MDVRWLLIAGLSLVVLALELWSRSSGRSGGRTESMARTVRTRPAARLPALVSAACSSHPDDRYVLPERGLPVVVSGRRQREPEPAVLRRPLSRTLEAVTIIRAPAARVWDALSNFASYPHWNPYIRRIVGEAREGARIEVSIQPPGRIGMTCWSTLVEMKTGRMLRWRHRLLLPGVLDHEHRYLIEPLAGDRVRLVQREVYTGLLAPILPRGLDGSTLEGFRAMHEALCMHTGAMNRF